MASRHGVISRTGPLAPPENDRRDHAAFQMHFTGRSRSDVPAGPARVRRETRQGRPCLHARLLSPRRYPRQAARLVTGRTWLLPPVSRFRQRRYHDTFQRISSSRRGRDTIGEYSVAVSYRLTGGPCRLAARDGPSTAAAARNRAPGPERGAGSWPHGDDPEADVIIAPLRLESRTERRAGQPSSVHAPPLCSARNRNRRGFACRRCIVQIGIDAAGSRSA